MQKEGELFLCLRAMYGFADAPLMSPLAPNPCLKEETGASSSVSDDSFPYLTVPVDGVKTLALIMTAHVGDLHISGCNPIRRWIKSAW
eukprot:8230489-Pyramimonas_sp.AAC.1